MLNVTSSGAWPSLSDEIRGLTEELERDFRFGHSVIRLNGNYLLGGSIKGGSSTIWAPATRAQKSAFEAWHAREGIPQEDDPDAFEVMSAILEQHHIARCSLSFTQSQREADDVARHVQGCGYIYSLLAKILQQLPAHHLSSPTFSGLQLGGWGPDGAKASAYQDGTVYIYDFALQGARRTFAGLFLHEVGHTHEAGFRPSVISTLTECHSVIGEAFAFVGLEYLLDAESRKVYQQFLLGEFLAETYVIYTAAARGLRAFIEQQTGRVREAWDEVYRIHLDSFDGIEYD